jgi:hypothetical protein
MSLHIVDSGGATMQGEDTKLDELYDGYKAAVEKWIRAIRAEEGLASADHSVAAIDMWEAAHFEEEKQRNLVTAAKRTYEDALREKNFGF